MKYCLSFVCHFKEAGNIQLIIQHAKDNKLGVFNWWISFPLFHFLRLDDEFRMGHTLLRTIDVDAWWGVPLLPHFTWRERWMHFPSNVHNYLEMWCYNVTLHCNLKLWQIPVPISIIPALTPFLQDISKGRHVPPAIHLPHNIIDRLQYGHVMRLHSKMPFIGKLLSLLLLLLNDFHPWSMFTLHSINSFLFGLPPPPCASLVQCRCMSA